MNGLPTNNSITQHTHCATCLKIVWISFLVGMFAHVFPQPGHTGPWSKDLGHVYAKVSGNVFLANGFRNAQGTLSRDVFYTGITTTAYAEVGLGYGFQILATLPYTIAINAFQDGARFTQGSFADTQLGLQWMLPLRLPLVMAFRADIKIPTYDINTFMNQYPDVGIRFPVHGDGQIDITLWYALGGNIPRLPFYGFVEVGYRFRTEAFWSTVSDRTFLDNFVFHAQWGWYFWQRMILSVNFRGTLALGEDTYTQSFLTLGLGFYLPVWKGLAIEATFDPTLWAKNSSQGYAFSLGLSYQH